MRDGNSNDRLNRPVGLVRAVATRVVILGGGPVGYEVAQVILVDSDGLKADHQNDREHQ
jgi:hypothetical protein